MLPIRQFSSKSINFYRRRDNRRPNFQSPIMYPIIDVSPSLLKCSLDTNSKDDYNTSNKTTNSRIVKPKLTTSFVKFETRGHLRQIILQRPKSLNAITHEMVLSITEALLKWKDEKDCHSILIKSSSDNFSCGGDVLSLFDCNDTNISPSADAATYLHDHYRLCDLVASFEKPIISFFNGITMGGGLGLGMHGRWRIGTDTSRLAMPEAKIGFITDVGSSFFLPRLQGELGTYLALTATSLLGRQALEAGLTTHHFNEPHLIEDLICSLESSSSSSLPPNNLSMFIDHFRGCTHNRDDCKPLPPMSFINEMFSGTSSVDEIISNLSKSSSPFAKETLTLMCSNSLTSLNTILKLLRKGRNWPLRRCLEEEYGTALYFLRNVPSFRRAVVEKLKYKKMKTPTFEASEFIDVAPIRGEIKFF